MLLRNVHQDLVTPDCCSKVALVKGDYLYYHYGVDGTNDKGWGCGYRTLQTIASWLILNIPQCKEKVVPNLAKIQETLVEVGDKGKNFLNSKEWIGSYEIFIVLDQLFQTPCKLLHVNTGHELSTLTGDLVNHFTNISCPVMMGGDLDAASKSIMGIAMNDNDENVHLLVVDPHFINDDEGDYNHYRLQADSFINWVSLKDFVAASFYNLCLPLVRK